MSVNGAAAVDLSTANFNLYANASGFAGGTVNGPLVPNNDGGYYPAVYRVGNEDTAIRLGSITASLNDTDGSESLQRERSAASPRVPCSATAPTPSPPPPARPART